MEEVECEKVFRDGDGVRKEESTLRRCVNYSRRKDRLSMSLGQVLEAVDRSD